MREKERFKKKIDELQQENEKLRKYKRLSKNDIALWDDDLEFIKMLRLQKKELKEKIQDMELLLVDYAKENQELKDRIDKALKYNEIYGEYNVLSYELDKILKGGKNEN